MATAAEQEPKEMECMFCRQMFATRYFHTHLEMCSQHDHQWNKETNDNNQNTDSPQSDPPIDLIVKTLNGKQYDIHGLHSNDTILNIKNKLKDEGGVLPKDQKLMFNNKPLEDDKTLKDYNLKQGQSLYCIVFNYNDNKLNENKDDQDDMKILNSDHKLYANYTVYLALNPTVFFIFVVFCNK